MLQNLILSIPWILPLCSPPQRDPRKGRDQILPSGNLEEGVRKWGEGGRESGAGDAAFLFIAEYGSGFAHRLLLLLLNESAASERMGDNAKHMSASSFVP